MRREELFRSSVVRTGLRRRAYPDEPLALARWLGLRGPALMDQLSLAHEGRRATLREHWIDACREGAPNEALGGLAKSMVAVLDAERLVQLVPELRSLQVPWGFTARRLMVVLLSAMLALPEGRAALEGLRDKLETDGPFRFYPPAGIVRDTALLPMVVSALSGSGRVEVGPRSYLDVATLLAEALAT